jgi:PAS domain S-box-containing protein
MPAPLGPRVFEALGRISSLAVGCWRADGTIFDASDSLLEFLGCTREEMDGGQLNWHNISPPEYAPFDARALRQMQLLGECVPYQKEYLRRNGERIPVLVGGASFGKESMDAGCFFAVALSSHQELDQTDQNVAAPADQQHSDIRERLLSLTPREREIAEFLANGQSAKQIGRHLGISPKTVDNHRAAILAKMAVDNPTQLAHALQLLK